MAITGPKVPQWCWLQSEPFNWQKSLALGKNANKVVGMWLCLKMWLFYLNFLTSFNPAVRVWGFSSGFPHTGGPAWARSANECLFRTSLCEAQQNHKRFPDGISWNCPSPGSHGYCFTGAQLWKTGVLCMKVVSREIQNLSARNTALHHQGLVYVMDLKAGISPDGFFSLHY